MPTIFTVDGEHFQDEPGGLIVLKGADATAAIRAAVDKINEKYKDSVIFIFGITYNSKKEAVDGSAFIPKTCVFAPDQLDEIDRIENRVIPKYVHVKQDSAKSLHETWRARQPINRSAAAGRNDRCPCGSGRKYKRCCMRK